MTESRKRRWRRRVLLALTVLFTLWLGSTGLMTWKLTHRDGRPFSEPISIATDLPLEERRIATTDGEQIGAWLVRGRDDTPIVLLLHSLHGSRKESLALMRRLSRDGVGSLAITLRGHGDSTGDTLDFGYSSRADVIAAVNLLRHEFPQRKILICGTSLGSAAAIFAAKDLVKQVSGYFLVSPYRDLSTAVRNRLQLHLPRVADSIAYAGMWMWARLLLHTDPHLISPYDAIADIPADVPVIILTGANDRHATTQEASDLYQRVESHAKLLTFPTAGHANLLRDDSERYYSALREMLGLHAASQPTTR